MSVSSKSSSKYRPCKVDAAKQLSEIKKYGHLNRHLNCDQHEIMIKELVQLTDLPKATIRNVVTYTVCLLKPGEEIVDEVMFKAELVSRFNIKSPVILEHIYCATCNIHLVPIFSPKLGGKKQKRKNQQYGTSRGLRGTSVTVSLYNYCLLICIYICDDFETKVQFVFQVLDQKRNNEIDIKDLIRLVRESVDFSMIGADIDDKHDQHEENLRDIADLLIHKFDINRDGSIDQSEFHEIMQNDALMLDCLGEVMPSPACITEFKALIINRLPLEVRAHFRYERKNILNQAPTDKDIYKDLYPIRLEAWL